MPAESKFWKFLKAKSLLLNSPTILQRVENSVTTGQPDVLVLHDRITSLLELKSDTSFTPTLGLEARQRYFMFQWIKAGGRALVAARIHHDIILIPGTAVATAPRTSRASQQEHRNHWISQALYHSTSTTSNPFSLYEFLQQVSHADLGPLGVYVP